jgi:hypothetical protein
MTATIYMNGNEKRAKAVITAANFGIEPEYSDDLAADYERYTQRIVEVAEAIPKSVYKEYLGPKILNDLDPLAFNYHLSGIVSTTIIPRIEKITEMLWHITDRESFLDALNAGVPVEYLIVNR